MSGVGVDSLRHVLQAEYIWIGALELDAIILNCFVYPGHAEQTWLSWEVPPSAVLHWQL